MNAHTCAHAHTKAWQHRPVILAFGSKGKAKRSRFNPHLCGELEVNLGYMHTVQRKEEEQKRHENWCVGP